jgi:hypothetical protein
MATKNTKQGINKVTTKKVVKKKVPIKSKPAIKKKIVQKKSKKLITIADLSDDQVESCINGSSNINLVRNLFEENYRPDLKIVDEKAYGAAFAEAIQGFIGVDEIEEPENWKEAYAINQEWGESMANSVNDLLKELNT